MEDPGHRLKRIRERLRLTLRDVENESQVIVDRRKSQEYKLGLSRLSEIENHSVVPSMYRIYSLCAIYRLDISKY
jgi:transcriptional regulator with XRE-family HTH domain